jgi:hypothetical protein
MSRNDSFSRPGGRFWEHGLQRIRFNIFTDDTLRIRAIQCRRPTRDKPERFRKRVRSGHVDMTRLAGGWADVPVDASKRTIDGDESGETYDRLAGALTGHVPALTQPLEITRASRQVVAGLNWKILVPIDDQSCYEAIVWQQLPCNGGQFTLTSIHTVPRLSPDARPVTGDEETLEECDRSVSFALQSLSRQSNSLAPFELVRLVRATRCGPLHDLRLEVRQGRGSTISVEMLIREADNGFKVDKLSFL